MLLIARAAYAVGVVSSGSWYHLTRSPTRRQHLAIEFDGGTHRDRMVEDNCRQNGLIGAGYRLLRFTAADVYGAPDTVAMQVRHALAKR